MKKVFLFAAAVSALSFGGVALAQDTAPADQTMPTDQAAPTAPADQTMPADQSMPAGQTMPADQTAPAAPAPSNEMPTPQPSTENYPVCSRTVTDKCINPSEAGRAGWHKGAHHRTRAHHKTRAHHRAMKKTTTTATTTATPQ